MIRHYSRTDSKNNSSSKDRKNLTHKSRCIVSWMFLTVIATGSLGLFAPEALASKSGSRVTMFLYVNNLAKPDVLDKGDTLHLIAVAYLNGNHEVGGEINVTSNDPFKKQI